MRKKEGSWGSMIREREEVELQTGMTRIDMSMRTVYALVYSIKYEHNLDGNERIKLGTGTAKKGIKT